MHPFRLLFLSHFNLRSCLYLLLVWGIAHVLFSLSYWLCRFFTRYYVVLSTMSYLTWYPWLFSSAFAHILHSINPLLSCVLDTYILSASIMKCSSLIIVITFLVFLSISSSPFFFSFRNTCTISRERNSYHDLNPIIECTLNDWFHSPQIFSPKVRLHFTLFDFAVF